MKSINNISARDLPKLPNGRYVIGDNLIYYVRYEGKSREYRFRYSRDSKRREITIGAADQISLSEAKSRAKRCAALLASGLDPKEVREEGKRQRVEGSITFQEFYERIIPSIISAKMLRESSKSIYLRKPYLYIMPVIGDRPIKDITVTDVVDLLKPLWYSLPRTASVVRGLLEMTFAYAKREGVYKGDNPATWKYNVDMYLPPINKVVEIQHRRFASPESLATLMRKLCVYNWWRNSPKSVLYTLLLFLTACRANEIGKLRWREVDLEKRTLTIPVERKKFKKGDPFVVPLSTQAMEILQKLKEKHGPTSPEHDFVFSVHGLQGIVHARKLLANQDTCFHGIRTSFRNWCIRNNVDSDLAETCLMHAIGRNATERSYLRDDLLDLRAEIMQRWADYLLPYDMWGASFLTDEQRQCLLNWPWHKRQTSVILNNECGFFDR
ncbi:tyrosine-type recombinase/integrase [Sutterella sp.]|uniref:tyrosine-type recombinase/integrase n=1 Tax=Sutterella sp. TaxID=1981025 RepID=UPI003FD769B6